MSDAPFYREYLDYAALTRQLQHWAERHPDLVRLQSLQTTPEKRNIWLLTIGLEPERPRPAVWVDGNMHAGELAGSSVALAIAEAAIALHMDDHPQWPDHLLAQLRDVLFHICPRISPDGAEAVLTRGGFVRSVPRNPGRQPLEACWEPADLDGDGRCRFIRMEDPAGDFVASADHPGLMLPRVADDPPPWYRLFPEGEIVNWDGRTIPEPAFLRQTTDLNRNFPWNWAPEPAQLGAGDYPGSEPESRAIIQFATANPNLYAWLNLHTFGGVFIRPLGEKPDSDMHGGDLALYRQLEAWAEEDTGYPTVSGYEEFTYEPGKPLHGDLTDFAYHQRGCLAEVCELWDLFTRLGLPRPKRFVDYYASLSREDMEALAGWDAKENRGRIFRNWTAIDHPQLGSVEVGGQDPLIGLWNPPPEALPGLCRGMARYWLRVAAMLPRLVIERTQVTTLDGGNYAVEVDVANHGYLGTCGIPSSRDLPVNHPLRASLVTTGCSLLAAEDNAREIGQLDGWGRGVGDGSHMPWFQRSVGNRRRETLRWIVRGEGTGTVRVGNQRLGWVERTVAVGEG